MRKAFAVQWLYENIELVAMVAFGLPTAGVIWAISIISRRSSLREMFALTLFWCAIAAMWGFLLSLARTVEIRP